MRKSRIKLRCRIGWISAVAISAVVLGSCSDGATSVPPDIPEAGSTKTSLTVAATDRLRFEPDALSMPAGEEVALTLSAGAGLEHDFVVEDGERGRDLHVTDVNPGQTATATFQIDEPGTYSVYCSVPGHRNGGMEGTLIVESQP